MKELLQSAKIKAILWILGGVIVLLLMFTLGAMVGYRQAVFAGRFGDNYYHNFYGPTVGRPFFNPHGAAGEVIDLSSSTISIKDFDGDEHSILVFPGTVIRKGDNTIVLTGINVGDMITVIGTPNESGQVEAKLVRVLTSPSSVPRTPYCSPTQSGNWCPKSDTGCAPGWRRSG